MKMKIAMAAVLLAAALVPGVSSAKPEDKAIDMSISDVLNNPEYQAKLPAGVKYFFADQPVTVKSSLGETRSNKRTSNGKGPKVSCEWAMASALIAIGEDAKLKGGNAVVGIKSNRANIVTASTDTYRCGIGGLMVNVALIGDVAVVD